MSNLSELLPAGGGGKNVDFVASGTLGNGVAVALNSDGTVSAVASDGNPEALGSPVLVDSTTSLNGIAATFDPVNNKVVVIYRDPFPYSGKAEVGTVSGTSISFGSAVTFTSSNPEYISSCYDSANGKIIIGYQDANNSGYQTAVVGTVSGTSISFGTPVVRSVIVGNTSLAYDSGQEKVVMSYQNGSNGQGYATVITVSGTSLSYGSTGQFETGVVEYVVSTYDSTNGKIVVAYRDSSASNRGTAAVGTVSGTTISFGSPVQFQTGQVAYVSIAYDSTNSKVVVAYRNANSSDAGQANVGTVSGTSISFGSYRTFNSGATRYTSVSYDANSQKIVIAYQDDGNSDQGTLITGTVSGTSITFDTEQVFDSSVINYTASAYDSVSSKLVIAYGIPSANDAKAVVFVNSSTNSADFIGITDAAISDTASGSVTIKGGISTNVTGLTPNADYYVQSNGSLSTTVSDVFAGKALSSTSINLDYTS